MSSTKNRKVTAGLEALLQDFFNQRKELEKLCAAQGKEEIRIQKILGRIKKARERNQGQLLKIIESATLAASKLQQWEEGMNHLGKIREFEETWHLPALTSKNVEDLWHLESWKIFPKLSDERLTGPQRKALRRVYGLLQAADLYTVGELTMKSAMELRKYWTVGDKTIKLIEQFLHYYGLGYGYRPTFDIPPPVDCTSVQGQEFPPLEEIFAGMVTAEREQFLRSLDHGKWPHCIERLGQLTLYTRVDLLSFRDMKPEWVDLIEMKMKGFNLTLRPL